MCRFYDISGLPRQCVFTFVHHLPMNWRLSPERLETHSCLDPRRPDANLTAGRQAVAHPTPLRMLPKAH
jgi:hypothetical protein